MSDQETLNVYAGAARQYADGFAKPTDTCHDLDLDAFVAALPESAHVLDLGCGPGHWAARLRDRDLTVSASDASPEMVALAREDFGVEAQIASFEDLDEVAAYDGVWANFSLLHAPRRAFPDHLARVHKALKPRGMFHIGMKLGESEGRDKLGRFYAYYGEDELIGLLEQAGFTTLSSRRGNGQGLAGDVEPFVVILAHA
ncbi:MAG: class I SAM-dependent methyltransferase [Rhodobacteraceae bacterium]|nr:class I SAM-dependent methyltransferase [Paracoccaceae bacterium]